MQVQELRALDMTQLQEELVSSLRELFNLRMQRSHGEESKPHLFSNNRKRIARIKTILREKQVEKS